jgi:hypothetical protein
MFSLILLAAYALICSIQLAHILRSEPDASAQPDEAELAVMAGWWYGFPV